MQLEYQPTTSARASLIKRGLRWWLRELRMIFLPLELPIHWDERHAANLHGRSVVVEMPENMGFFALIDLPEGSADRHRRALHLKRNALLPLPTSQLCSAMGEAAHRAGEGVTYGLVAFRRADLEAWEQELRAEGARSVRFSLPQLKEVSLCSPTGRTQQRRDAIIPVVLAVGCLVAIWAALWMWTSALEARIAEYADLERAARSELSVARAALEASRLDAEAASVLDFTTVETLAADLTDLARAMPEDGVVRRIEWAPDTVELYLVSAKPVSTLALKGWQAEADHGEVGVSEEWVLSRASGAPAP